MASGVDSTTYPTLSFARYFKDYAKTIPVLGMFIVAVSLCFQREAKKIIAEDQDTLKGRVSILSGKNDAMKDLHGYGDCFMALRMQAVITIITLIVFGALGLIPLWAVCVFSVLAVALFFSTKAPIDRINACIERINKIDITEEAEEI